MNIKENQQSSAPMCISCKSFFGNEATARMCSQCFKKLGASEPKKEETAPVAPVKANKESKELLEKKKEEAVVEEAVVEKASKDRCSTCSRKLRLLGVECRCGLFFCNSHRLPEDHQCSFNHKNLGKEKLSKQVIKVQNGKIESI